MSQVPTNFRRATMMVNDIEGALEIYRDILGMTVYYDENIVVTGAGLPAGEPNAKTRLVILQGNDANIGMLGILQYLDPPLPAAVARPEPNRVRIGETVFVLHTKDVRAAWPLLQQVAGIEMVSEPSIAEYPKQDGGVFRVLGLSFFDPNGYFVELNQFL